MTNNGRIKFLHPNRFPSSSGAPFSRVGPNTTCLTRVYPTCQNSGTRKNIEKSGNFMLSSLKSSGRRSSTYRISLRARVYVSSSNVIGQIFAIAFLPAVMMRCVRCRRNNNISLLLPGFKAAAPHGVMLSKLQR